jgi:hypothetical protein
MGDTSIDLILDRESSEKNQPTKSKAPIESEDISMSQLEMMANKKKLNKKSSENPPTIVSIKEKAVTKGKPSTRSDTTTNSLTKSKEKVKRKEVKVSRENKDDLVRKEKSELLYKFSKLNLRGKWSSLNLDMNCTLEEIKNEVERVRNEIQTERSVGFYKRMLLLGVQGIEMMNTKFDPLGVDLDGWSEAMGYSMENQEYDEVMAELYEKYKGSGQMSPEMKLVFMIISSATMFTITKRITKLDTSNAFASFLGNMGVKTPQPEQQQQPPPIIRQPPQPPQNSFQYMQQQQQPQHQHQQYQQPNNRSDTTDDDLPSKLKGPDDVDIENILKTMNERKREKVLENVKTETSDDEGLFKNIPLNTPKKGRGRPRKVVQAQTNKSRAA